MPQPWPWGLMNVGDPTGGDPELGHRRHCASADARVIAGFPTFTKCHPHDFEHLRLDKATVEKMTERLCPEFHELEDIWFLQGSYSNKTKRLSFVV